MTRQIENMAKNLKSRLKQDPKVKLSALWLFVMLTYTYGDVVTLMDPVKHGSIQLTDGFLLGGSIFMMIPITMVLLSRILKPRVIRWSSIVAGIIMTVSLSMTLFAAVPTMYYIFFTVIEITSTVIIVWIAWKWHNSENSTENVERTEGQNI
jgi:threonine/homoserine/homoserine lactone efflux protein